MLKRLTLLTLVLAGPGLLYGLDWTNTGELAGAIQVNELALGPGGHLYAAANTADEGRVYYSSDFTTWQLSGTIPGSLASARALTLDGSGALLLGGNGDYAAHSDAPLVYRSADGANWSFLSRLTGSRVGTSVLSLFTDDAGQIHAGHNYLGMNGAAPCRSTDHGATWVQPTVPANPDGMGPFHHYRLLQVADDDVFVGAWNAGGRMLRSTDRGGTWQHTGGMYDAGHIYAAAESPDGTLFAGTAPKNVPAEPIGRVFKSTDHGANWTQLGYGSFSTTSWIRSLAWTSDGNLYAGSAPRTPGNDAEVFVSGDAGATWSSAGTLPGARDIYRLLELEVSGREYLYAATGPNGDVFRAELSPVGIEEPACPGREKSGLTLSPNPLTGRYVMMRYSLAVAGPVTVSLFDPAGRLISVTKAPGSLAAGSVLLDLRSLRTGVYLVTLQAPGVTTTRKLVKQE
ncbi:MAG TPA: T9SS type A sorting domain-containing protein [candidate division WOR-3 bacterium]|uniref:T9SS type A sorting domain-containing protein n=1 Tax=candidate division WOR-3 bacterium TaxID=2052148 RepID=A0A7V0T759_UNCW3|nr:T9SS type A sorting domain-containing protein [candidate division WOR-3 bacterium]